MNNPVKSRITIIAFVLPSLILFILLMALPITSSVYVSLLNWDGIGKATFVGLSNYIDLLVHNLDDFWITVKNSLAFAGMSVFIQLPLALILAIILANGTKGEKFFRTAYFMPVVVSSVIIGALFFRIYNEDYGLLNYLMDKIGLSSLKRGWLVDDHTALVSAFVPQIWQFIGYHMLLLYAAIKQIPSDIVEAARIDGASKFQIARKITLPLITPMIEVCVVFAAIGSLKVFDLLFVLTTNGEPNGITRVPAGLMYREIFTFNMSGLGSAIAIFIVAECLFFTILIQKFFKSKEFSY